MSKEWLWWLGEFGLVAVVAIVAGFVTRDVPISILYGLFVGTVFFILREHRRVGSQFERHVAELEDKALDLPATLRYKQDIDTYLQHLVRLYKDETYRVAKEAAEGEVLLKSRALPNIAMDLFKLARPGDKIFATNYGIMFDTPQGNAVRQINFDVAERGVDITRVFVESITAKPEEKKHLREEMDRQKEHLNVRFVKESRLPPEARRNILMMYDRYVAYATYVKLVGTGQGQLVDEIRINTRRDELEKAKDLAETIIKLSEEYK